MLLDSLIAEVRRARGRPKEVTDILERYLSRPGLLTRAQQEPDPSRYRQHVLHVEPGGGFSVVALAWLPGQETPIHDHVSWCVIGTYLGAEDETRYRLEGSCLVVDSQTVNTAGTAVHVEPPGDIHSVRNGTTGKVVSIHIYGADIGVLGSSIRRVYHLPIRRP